MVAAFLVFVKTARLRFGKLVKKVKEMKIKSMRASYKGAAVALAMCALFGCTKTEEGSATVSCLGPEEKGLAPLPVSRAPFVRTGAVRQSVKMVVSPLSYQTNLWQGVEFVSGTKRLIMSGVNHKIDCNQPLRFGRLCLLNGETLEGELVMLAGAEWSFKPQSEDSLVVDAKGNRATWSRPWMRPDGKKAIFSYTVTGRPDGTATVDWDFGLSLEEALAQTNQLAIGSWFRINDAVALDAQFGFGDRLHEMYPREKLLAAKQTQIFFMVPNSAERVLNFEKRNELRHWSVTFPKCWSHEIAAMDFVGREVNGKLLRGTTYHYGVADFRNGNPKGYATKGRLVFDFGKSSELRGEPKPPVGGLDFWGYDAIHVPQPPTCNWLMNGSFEQGLKGWRWEDGGAEYRPAEHLNEEIAEGGKFGRHALVLRHTQWSCPAMCSASMPLVVGRTYTVSCWVKAAGKEAVDFMIRPCSVATNGKYRPFGNPNEIPRGTARVKPGEDWQRVSTTFTADAGGFYVQLSGGGTEGVLVDGIQVEEGAKETDFAEAPFIADLVTMSEYNDLKPGEPIDARLDVQALTPETVGRVKVTVKNGYFEKMYEKTFDLKGDAVLPLDLDAKKLGTGIFIVGMDFEAGNAKWSDYARFIIQEPLANKHATSQFYANFAYYNRVSRGEHFAQKFVEWGFGATDGRNAGANAPIHAIEQKLGIRNYVHPVSYFPQSLMDVAKDLKVNVSPNFHEWKEVTADGLRVLEESAYRQAMVCDPLDSLWTCWNEEEGWAKKVGYDEHFKCVEACMKGVRRAFKERGLPPPRFSPSHGLSGYAYGRNYDALEGYLSAAAKKGYKYDVITAHTYANIDGGILGKNDADVETQHLLKTLEKYGYPETTQVMFTESFGHLSTRIPPWGTEGGGDWFRQNTQPSHDLGFREPVMAGSLARMYILGLKFWPKLQMIHPWISKAVWDMRFSPITYVFAPNVLGHLLSEPKFFGDAQPYADVRGYCFLQKQADGSTLAVMPIWTTNNDVEMGTKESPALQMMLPKDVAFIDFFGNRRAAPKPDAAGISRVPLMPMPLYLVSRDAGSLLKAMRDAVADDPSLALTPDIQPDISGNVNLVLKNETKVRQKGTLTVAGKERAFDIAPNGTQNLLLFKGETTPMKLQSWTGALSLLPNPWEVQWFFVPKCGAKPDWSKIPSLPMLSERIDPGYGKDRMALKARYQVAYNKDFFFLRVEAEDPNYISYKEDGVPFISEHKLHYQHDGCLEVYFDGFADARRQGEKGYDLNDMRYDIVENDAIRLVAVNPQLAEGMLSATDKEINEKLIRKFTRTEKGYVYEVALAARYMAPVDLKSGTVAGFGLALHDWNGKGKTRGHATLSNTMRPGTDANQNPYLWPLMVFGK